MNRPSPTRVLIERRCLELGLTALNLIRRAGYQNTTKGLRRLEQLMNGDLDSSRGLIAKLPEALELPAEIINQAVEETRRQIREQEHEEWLVSFKPHAIILTEREIPSQICFAILTGAHRLLRIDFDLSKDLRSYVRQAFSEYHRRLLRWRDGEVPFFGKAVGIIVNYAPERAVRYDLEGTALEIIRGAYRSGEANLQIGNRQVSEGQVKAVFGIFEVIRNL